MVAETAVDEAVVVNGTCTSTREILASRGTTKIQGVAHTAEAVITGEGDTTNLRTITLLQLKSRAIRMDGTHHKTIIRTTNGAGTEDNHNPSRHTIRGPRISSHPTEVAEEGTILDTTARTEVGRMGTLEGEAALLPIEGARHMVAGGMAIKEAREGGMDMAVTVADTISPRRTAVTIEVVTTEAAVITPVEAINPVEATSQVDHTALVSSLMGTEEDTTKEAEVVGGDTDHRCTDAHTKNLLRFASSMFSSCFESPLATSLLYIRVYITFRNTSCN